MRILALDLSLTASGFVRPNGSYGVIVPPRGQDRGMPRLKFIRDYVMSISDGVNLVVIEGYAFGAMNKREALGELGGVVRLALYEAGIEYVEIPPSSMKQYATGKGNASKDMVFAEAIRRLGYTGSDNNVADAMWLRAMALDAYDVPIVQMPAKNREALAKVKWPDVGAVV